MPIGPSPAVSRAGALLEHLARHPSQAFSVSELARLVEVPRATCDAILLALSGHGLVARDGQDRRYTLGPACIALGNAARIANPLVRSAAVEAEQLARETSTCTAVCIRDGDEARVVEMFDHGPPFGLRSRIGEFVPLVPPMGVVFVAWSEADAERWLTGASGKMEAAEERRYRKALDAVRRRGFSVTTVPPRRPELEEALETLANDRDAPQARRIRDEMLNEMLHSEYLPVELDGRDDIRLTQLSAPVFDHEGRVAAAVMVLGPGYDLTSAELRQLGERTVAAAAAATRHAGGVSGGAD